MAAAVPGRNGLAPGEILGEPAGQVEAGVIGRYSWPITGCAVQGE
jgi:hypothetical protein